AQGIGQLESLASLDLEPQPNLTSLPDEIGNLSKLWEMPLDGLKLSLDASLIRGRTKDLVGYFHQKLNKSVSHYRMKLMLVGFGGRGKTSLLRALMKLKQPERQSPPTRGHSPSRPWSAFCRSEAIYLLIYSLQPEARRCPVICVGTHADTLPSSGPNRDTIIANIRTRIETMIRRPGFPEIVEYVEVNAIRDNASVERLRTVIQSALEAFKVKGHHVMGQMVPESYVKLETLVMERARNTGQDLPVLQWYQLRKMATDAGLNMNDEKLSQAVRFLHESGVLLHFDDSTYRLNNLYFIDPQWLCRMMAANCDCQGNQRVHQVGRDAAVRSRLLFTGKRITEEDRHFIFPKNDELLIPCRLPDIAARDVTELAPVRRHSTRPRNLLLVVIDRSFITLRSQHPKDGQAGHVCLLAASGDWNRAAAATAASYDEAFFLLQTFEEATPEGGEGLQL
uniref:COR domain-containing protein n=1 Tax=Macrostomum lignano TaxID=282301 RepID=A0A1I8F9Y8_9PLAT